MKDKNIGLLKRVWIISVVLILSLAVIPMPNGVVSGTITVSMELEAGWNLKGMPKSMTASDLALKSNHITIIVHRTSDGHYVSYIPSIGITDFVLELNEGVFIYSEEDTTITFIISPSSGYMGGDLTVTGDFNVTGDCVFDKNLTVIGSMSVVGNFEANSLNVTGDLTVDGDLRISENLVVGEDLTVNGNLMVAKDLTVGNMTITEDMNINDDLAVSGDATIDGNSIVTGDMEVLGNLTAGDFTVGNLTISDDLTINGNLSVARDTMIGGDSTVVGDMVVGGNLTAGNFTVGDLTISEDLSISGNLSVAGDTMIGGDAIIAGNLTAGNFTVVNLTIAEDLSINGNLTVTGDATIGGNLTVTDDITIEGDYTITENLTVGGDLFVTGNITGLTFAETANYIIFKDAAGNIYAKNGDTGAIDFKSTNASYVINSALAALPTGTLRQEAGKVVLREGRYIVDSTINVPYSTWLIGQGGKGSASYGQTRLDWTGGNDDVIIYNEPGIVSYDVARGGGIIGIGIDGNDNANAGIRMRLTWHTTIEDIAIRDCTVGLVSEANVNLDMYRFDIYHNNGDGIYLTEYGGYVNSGIKIFEGEIGNNGNAENSSIRILSGKVFIANTWFENTYTEPGNMHLVIDDSQSSEPEVQMYGNRFQSFGTAPLAGIKIDGGRVYLADSFIYSGARSNASGVHITDGYLIMDGNEIKNWGSSAGDGAGVNIDGGTAVVISDNRFEGYFNVGYAVHVTGGTRINIEDNNILYGGVYAGADHIKISDNRFRNVSDEETACIYLNGSYCDVTDNYIDQTWSHGIYSALGETGNRIIGNRLINIGTRANNAYDAIYVGGDSCIVDNNYIFSDQVKKPRYGIYVPNQNYVSISKNYIEGPSTYDIYVLDGSNCQIEDNTVPNGLISVTPGRGHTVEGNMGYDVSTEDDTIISKYNYIVYRDNTGNFFAENGSTGNITFQSTNAHDVIQYALDNCPAGIGHVYVREGRYDIDSTIEIPYGVSFEGAGMGRIYWNGSEPIPTTGTWLQWIGSFEDFIIYNSAGVTQSHTRRANVIKGFTINGVNSCNVGIKTINTMHHTIESVTVYNTGGDGIVIAASFGQDIINCDVTLSGDNGIHLTDHGDWWCTFIKIHGCEIGTSGDYNVRIESGTKVSITECWFENGGTCTAPHLFIDEIGHRYIEVRVTDCNIGALRNATHSIKLNSGRLYFNHNNVASGGADKKGIIMNGGELQAEGNRFSHGGSATSHAVYITGGIYALIKGNRIEGSTSSDYSVYITSDIEVLIQGNQFNKNGVYTESHGTVIQNNEFMDSYGEYVIHLNSTENLVDNNQIEGAYYEGILIAQDNNKVIGNQLLDVCKGSNNIRDGIIVQGNDCEIIGNTISSDVANKPRYGIFVDNKNYISITNNDIEGPATYDINATGNYIDISHNVIPNGLIFTQGSDIIIENNLGYLTENSGTTSAGTLIVVDHGLAGTPDQVIITPLDLPGYYYVSSKGPANFTIISELPIAFDWYAIYNP